VRNAPPGPANPDRELLQAVSTMLATVIAKRVGRGASHHHGNGGSSSGISACGGLSNRARSVGRQPVIGVVTGVTPTTVTVEFPGACRRFAVAANQDGQSRWAVFITTTRWSVAQVVHHGPGLIS
jgi:hypothetical protein